MWVKCNPNPLGKTTGDCVVRAIAIATDQSWRKTYRHLCDIGDRQADMPNSKNPFMQKFQQFRQMFRGDPRQQPRVQGWRHERTIQPQRQQLRRKVQPWIQPERRCDGSSADDHGRSTGRTDQDGCEAADGPNGKSAVIKESLRRRLSIFVRSQSGKP